MIPTQQTTYRVYVLAVLKTLTHGAAWPYIEDPIEAMTLMLDDLNRDAESFIHSGFKILSGTDHVAEKLIDWGESLGSNRPQRAVELLGDIELRLSSFEHDPLSNPRTVIEDLIEILSTKKG